MEENEACPKNRMGIFSSDFYWRTFVVASDLLFYWGKRRLAQWDVYGDHFRMCNGAGYGGYRHGLFACWPFRHFMSDSARRPGLYDDGYHCVYDDPKAYYAQRADADSRR